MNQLTLGSLFDGIGGFPLAGIQAGIRPVWASEIEPFPVRVTQKRLPDMRHYGDVNDLNGGDLEPVDIITFGSPCQDLSIAGKRSGLDGARSGLFREAIRIITEMRRKTNGQYPRWAVWENVPGALSSAHGQDFREVLESLIHIKDSEANVPMPENGRWLSAGEIMGDSYSLAWRTIDAAKGWGVAQRRKRIFAVLDLDGPCAGSVLFESEGLSGYTPPRCKTRQAAARGSADGTGETGIRLNDQGYISVAAFYPQYVTPPSIIGASGFCTEHSADSRSIGYHEEESPTLRAGIKPGVAIEFNPTDSRIKIKEDGICQTLCSRMGTGGNTVPLTLKIRSDCEGCGKGALIQTNLSATLGCNKDQTLFEPTVYGISADRSNAMLSDNPHSGIYEAETSRTLDRNGGSPACNQGGMMIVEPVYAVTTGEFTAVGREQSPPLMARDWKDPPVVGEPRTEYLVRRLTPDECCRLQGYPDGWCKGLESTVPTEDEILFWEDVFRQWDAVNGKPNRKRSRNAIVKWLKAPNTDAAEYKAYGNSVAVPCVFFVLAGIVWAQNKEVSF